MNCCCVAAVLALSSLAAQAQTTVVDAWVRGTVAQQRATGVYAQITSVQGGRLVSVSTPVASLAEIHEMTMDDNVMRMRALPNGLPLPPGKTVVLKSGGMHIMLMGLTKPLQPGDQVPLSMTVERADKSKETVNVIATVRALGAKATAPAVGGGGASSP
jgi:periplasmic copper chaperone A